MALGIQSDASLIKPLEGAIVRRFTAGAAVTVGQVVSMQSDGKVDPSNTTSAAQANMGIALSAGGDGDLIDVVVFGPVSNLDDATPGLIYDNTTNGTVAASKAGNQTKIGVAISSSVLFVQI